MGRQKTYDYIVIGSGEAGRKVALKFAAVGKKVAIVEAHKWGGRQINTHETVYNTALGFSHLYYTARQGVKMGISSGNLRYNYPSVLNYRGSVVRKARVRANKELKQAGIVCLTGFAQFINKKEIVVNSEHLRAKHFIIATGQQFAHPQITGLEHVACYTSDNAFAVPRPPKRLVVIGGGESGCKIAQYYAEIGSKVTIVEQKVHLTPRSKPEKRAILMQAFAKELGINVRTNALVVALENVSGSHAKRVILRGENEPKTIETDLIILATGYTPFTDLGLENAKVKYDAGGIIVNGNQRTSNSRVWAVGTVAK